jgi:hypothetical protein
MRTTPSLVSGHTARETLCEPLRLCRTSRQSCGCRIRADSRSFDRMHLAREPEVYMVHLPRTFATLPPQLPWAQEPGSGFLSLPACTCPVRTQVDHSFGCPDNDDRQPLPMLSSRSTVNLADRCVQEI